MAPRLMSWLSRPALLGRLFAHGRLAVRLFREPRVPALTKVVPMLAALYAISPFDVLPDLAPVVGQIDDLAVVLMALEVFSRLCPPPARGFHASAIARGRPYSPMTDADDFIDADWREGRAE
jgi:uncharacterized membrane protein YkvA (DUF1232 family)